MALTHSVMIPLGTAAPPFRLPDTATGKTVALEEFKDAPALLVAFLCNHCPYVQHMLDGFVAFAREYGDKGLATVAISANDAKSYPADSPREMAKLAKAKSFPFAYLHDESQQVAKAYSAVCTPDLYLFDRNRKLVYRGQFDDSRPGGKTPVTGVDLRRATGAVLGGTPVPEEQVPSMGCSIKWKRG